MSIARGDAVALTRELVRVDSRNPSLVAGGPGRTPWRKRWPRCSRSWGLRVDLQHARPAAPERHRAHRHARVGER